MHWRGAREAIVTLEWIHHAATRAEWLMDGLRKDHE